MDREKEERLQYLRDRYNLRAKMFVEFCFVDKRIIPDFKKFSKETQEIVEEMANLVGA